ncbi:MAG: sulfatase-like hydrolase/transferase, partial [Phycisphaeraceae bacterium]
AQTTMAEMFKSAGYATAHVGKWHLHHGPGSRPLEQGFDYSFGHMGGCVDNYTHFFYWQGYNRHDLWEGNTRVRMPGKFFPDLMVEKATAFIEKHKAEPFFLYFALNLPHYPYQGDTKWVEHYKDLPYPRNIYAAFMSTLDERVTQLVGVVDRLKLTEDTIIIYQSDNGHSTEERAHGGGGSAGPYRGAKFSLFEGGIRLPAIISWPGHLPKGETRGQLAHSCDWLPTLAALCDVKLPEAKLHGVNIVGVIKSNDAKSPHEALHWQVGNQWAVRQGPWKLIHNVNPSGTEPALTPADRPFFLANLDDDPGERKNLAKKHPDIVKRLESLHGDLDERNPVVPRSVR